ncbi:MAG: ABC transporter substrate-binding protein [Burkholderiaceae bacterium]|nr:ABC transporter substrate-binding protein [Burkholderiaceae bacterium]
MQGRGRQRLIASLIVAACCAASAHAAAAAILIRDDSGRELRFERSPERIVSLLPSITESVCALGGCARLVGVDRYSNWPRQVASLPKVGALEDAQVERIVALKPDVVLASESARIAERLESMGLTVVLLQSQTQSDVHRLLLLLAQLLGDPSEGERAWSSIEHDIDQAAARVPASLHGKRVYFEVESDPYAAGPTSFIGQTLSRLGLGNVVPSELGPFPKLNPEFVVRSQPDIVMAAEREVRDMPTRPGWQGMEALKSGRVCAFEPAQYDVLVRPGPRLGEAAMILADCLRHLAGPVGRE